LSAVALPHSSPNQTFRLAAPFVLLQALLVADAVEFTAPSPDFSFAALTQLLALPQRPSLTIRTHRIPHSLPATNRRFSSCPSSSAFNTSSSKKRRITRQTAREHNPEERSNEPLSDQVLPSTEDDADPPCFSFSAASLTSGYNTPTYLRGDSLPASGIPPRLQANGSTLSGTDYTSSTASSPCAASTDLSVDNERVRELFEAGLTVQLPDNRRSPSPYIRTTRRALMGGAADQSQRSSSPLKRRASSMDLEQDADHKDDVDMLVAPGLEAAEESSQGTVQGDTSPPTDLSETKTETELPLRNDAPPLDQQVKTIEALVKAFNETAVQEGDTVFLVSRQWLSRAQGFGADAKRASKEPTQPQLGPVDNSDLIHSIIVDSSGQQFVRLKPGLGAGDFEAFPQEAWDLLMTWYGLQSGQLPIIRKAHNTAPEAVSMPNIQFEYYPPVFTIYRLWSATSPIPIEQELKLKKPPPITLARSTSYSYHSFLKEAKQRAGVQEDRKVRVWKLLQTLPAEEPAEIEGPAAQSSGIKTPPDSPRRSPEILGSASTGAWPEILVDVVTFSKLEKDVGRAIVDAEDTTVNPKYNGKKSLSLVGLAVDEVLVIDESVDKDNFVSTYSAASSRNDKALATRGSSSSLAAQTRANTSGRSSPALAGPLTRGRAQQKSGRTIGCCGLQNLGNTCYMNSALQCVRSVEELTKYFLTHEAKKEINPDNPLSHNGDVANAYGKLLEEIYKDPPPNSVQPRHFKSIIGRYAPAFSGYGQQDSQEFVGFLLDGLQEDLNRIKKKPYIEKPDSTDEMIHNPAAIREMAAKVWDITKKRDDSVIADLFTGMYKSTLVCPVCDKVSITFDPFNNLTLPLPLATMWSRTVKYVPLNDAPVEIDVDLDKNSSIRTLKQYVSPRVGVPVERLVAAEEFRDKFFKFYDDMSSISEEIQSTDIAAIHEVEASPTNNMTVVKKTKKYRSLLDDNDEEPAPPWEDPMAERLLVPVLHRINPDDPDRKSRSKKQGTWGELPPPHFIVVTPEEARSEDIIRRKVLEKVASYTTWSGFDEAETDPEMLNNTSDVDSGNAEVVAKSVEGEEDIVDVTMSGAPNGTAVPSSTSAATEKYPPLLKQFDQRRPKWIDPQEFLAPHFQNLFDLKYFRENNVPMPTGWQSIQEDTTLPTLSSRQPRPTSSDTEMRSPTPWDGSEESGSEGASPIQPPSVQTRMVDESSEEDSDFPKVKVSRGQHCCPPQTPMRQGADISRPEPATEAQRP
jgi:ubiquitin carboxyl-terminal hydrolase 4/11/15